MPSTIELIEVLLHISGYLLPGVHKHGGVGSQETRAQDSVVPVEDHARLMSLRLHIRAYPRLLIHQLREKLVAYAFTGPDKVAGALGVLMLGYDV